VSFSVHESGPLDYVRERIDAATVHGDPSQFDRVREFIRAELDDFPTAEGIGVTVSASGHHSETSRNVTISIQPTYLTVDR
jgi:hypothetical protein